MTSLYLFQKTIILRRRESAIFANIIKIITRFIKKCLKTQEKLKELEVMYQNAIYLLISGKKKC